MFKNKKIPHIELLPIIVLSFIFFKVINNIEILSKGLGIFVSYISSFIWAFAIAYLLNPFILFIEKKYKTKRALSILIIYIIVLGIIVLLVTIISPKIASNVKDLVSKTPTYVTSTEEWVNSNLDKLQLLDKYEISTFIRKNIEDGFQKIASIIQDNLTLAIDAIVTKAVGFTSSFVKLLFGFIVAIYMLKDKEIFIRNIKKFIYAVFSTEKAHNIVNFSREVNIIFSKYIIGKFIDSLIIGIICLAGTTILRIPYAALISLIVSITNMIPYFGPFIGAVPAIIITLFASPIKALWVAIFIIFLQQFDGWFLGPKILGSSVGLNPFWIILAIVIGGGTFGVIGMFLGVPVMAVIKMVLERYISRKLSEKKVDI